MKPEYKIKHDGMQWTLSKVADVKESVDHKLTGNIVRREIFIGFFPKIHQVIGRIYENSVADHLEGEAVIGDVGDLRGIVATSKVVAEHVVERAKHDCIKFYNV